VWHDSGTGSDATGAAAFDAAEPATLVDLGVSLPLISALEHAGPVATMGVAWLRSGTTLFIVTSGAACSFG
jgi:hypothetical protein